MSFFSSAFQASVFHAADGICGSGGKSKTIPDMNILLAGVGGQGILKASHVMAEAFLEMGLDVKMSEIHGLSQRGGSVLTHLRAGKKVYSPTIIEGDADYLLGFEKLETLRWVQFLKPAGKIIVNEQEILPVSCVTGGKKYPEDVEKTLAKYVSAPGDLFFVPALRIALKLGDVRTVNMAMVGAFSKIASLDEEVFLNVISRSFSEQAAKNNTVAFREGRAGV